MELRGRTIVVTGAVVVAVLALVLVATVRADDSRRRIETSRAPIDTTPVTEPAPRTTTSTTVAPTTIAPTTTAAPATTAAPTTSPPTADSHQPSADGTTLLVWTSGGLPAGFAEDVAAIPQVRSHTVVAGDLVAMVGSRDAAGRTVDAVADGWGIPIDAFAVDPATYAPFAPGADHGVLAALEPGHAVLTRSSAQLRRIGVGGVLALASGEVRVSGVVGDESGGGAELIVHRADAARLGIDDERFLLVTDSDRPAVLDEIRRRTPAGEHLSLRSSAEARWLRHGDRVEPQALVKRAFGEFSFRDASGRGIQIDPAWVEANIVTTRVPVLGQITCNRRIVPMVRRAMEQLERRGRADTVDPSRYAGCYNPRRIAPGAGLSRHSWGIALDLNIGANPRGTFESQDPELVSAMTAQGFSWGGQWEYPDPGHYEATARPDG